MIVTTLKVFNMTCWRSLIALDDKVFATRVNWNNRDEAWYLSLYANDLQETIIESVKIVLNTDLLQYAYSSFTPRGALLALSDVASAITLDNFGVDVQLQYITQIS
jgi:hypothetical protein